MSIPTLSTDRLLLRPFTLGDATAVQTLAGEFAIADTTLAIPHPYADGLAEQWIAHLAVVSSNGTGASFAITMKDQGDLVGAISLMNIAPDHQAELGYWIGVPFWGRGYCSEAGKMVVRHAFDTLGLRRLHAHHLSRNPASGRVLENLGFTHEGSRIGHVLKWGTLENVEEFGLMRESTAGKV